MAGDWIKMRMDLADDPAVIAIAAALQLDEDTVVGKLHRLWSWGDRHTTDGKARGVTGAWVDRYVNAEGFAAAMSAAGWLSVEGHGITFPRFDRHNGASAKRRAAHTRRVASSRRRADDAGERTAGAQKAHKPGAREEKKKEEKTREPDETGRDDQTCSWNEEERELVLALAQKVNAAVAVKPASRKADRSLILKACYLVASGKLPEDWLWDSVEATDNGKPKKNAAAYLQKCLENKATDNGQSLARLLAAVDVPEDLLDPEQPKSGRTRPCAS